MEDCGTIYNKALDFLNKNWTGCSDEMWRTIAKDEEYLERIWKDVEYGKSTPDEFKQELRIMVIKWLKQ